MIGISLQVQHRLPGRVAVEDRPNVLWERFDLVRLSARLIRLNRRRTRGIRRVVRVSTHRHVLERVR